MGPSQNQEQRFSWEDTLGKEEEAKRRARQPPSKQDETLNTSARVPRLKAENFAIEQLFEPTRTQPSKEANISVAREAQPERTEGDDRLFRPGLSWKLSFLAGSLNTLLVATYIANAFIRFDAGQAGRGNVALVLAGMWGVCAALNFFLSHENWKKSR